MQNWQVLISSDSSTDSWGVVSPNPGIAQLHQGAHSASHQPGAVVLAVEDCALILRLQVWRLPKHHAPELVEHVPNLQADACQNWG